MKRRLLPCLLLCLLLCGCGAAAAPGIEPSPAPAETAEPTPPRFDPNAGQLVIAPQEAAELCALRGELTKLRHIRLSEPLGSEDAEALAALREAFPAAQLDYTVMLFGESLPFSLRALDLSGKTPDQILEALPTMALLPALDEVRLPQGADWALVGAVQALPSSPGTDYAFELYERGFNTADELIDLDRVPVQDGGAALREALPYLTRCRRLQMNFCGLSNEEMAALREDFPQIQVVWKVSFGVYRVSTDTEKILASASNMCVLTSEDCEVLKYCTEVKYLDLGHNHLTDISFVSYMPRLEVAILALNLWTDASPLADCPELEYLEIFTTRCTDLSPLSGLTNLRYLNICNLKDLTDVTPLYGLTGLRRLWIGRTESIPAEQLEELRLRLPDTEINTTSSTPTLEGWRQGERYEQLKETFGYDDYRSFSINK